MMDAVKEKLEDRESKLQEARKNRILTRKAYENLPKSNFENSIFR